MTNELILQRNPVKPDIPGITGKLIGLGLVTLELPWLENKKAVSCIPEGDFPMWWGPSPRFKRNFWHIEVPGRRGILFHAGNRIQDTLGCILVGEQITLGETVRNHPYFFLINSRAGMAKLTEFLGKSSWRLRVESGL